MENSSLLGGFGRVLESKRTGRIFTFIIIPVLVILVLMLPPVNLIERIQNIGYTPIAPTSGQVIDPDGTNVIFPASGLIEGKSTYARLSSVPRADFERGDTDETLRAAAQALPGTLRPRSPVYQLSVHGAMPGETSTTIPIPNDSLPYETLDLYGWNGQTWEWLPSHVFKDEDVIGSTMAGVPGTFAVVQTSGAVPAVGVELPRGKTLPAEAVPATTMLFPAVLTLRGDGSVDGTVDIPPAGETPYKTFLTVRNFEQGQVPRTDLLSNLLIDGGMQEVQINTLAELAASGLYTGIALDYRGVDPPLRDDYTRFVSNLANRLHQDGKQLAVFVDTPLQQSEEAWETYGYDWRAIGQAADLVVVPGSENPLDYAAGGKMEKLLEFATDEIDRFKVQLRIPAHSVEQSGAYFIPRGYAEALRPLAGTVNTSSDLLQPGESVQAGTQSDIIASPLQFDPATGISWYRYRGQGGEERVVFLEDATSLASKVSLANRFNLGGVFVEALQSDDIDPGIWKTLSSYAAGQSPAMSEAPMAVAWTVTDPQGAVVAQANAALNEAVNLAIPATPGVYAVNADLVRDGQTLKSQGEAQVAVATFTPTATPTPEFTPTPSPTPTPTPPPYALAIATDTTNLRQGPGTAYGTAGQMAANQQLKIIGKNQDGSWWQLEDPNGRPVWILADRVNALGPVTEVAVAKDIPAAPQVAAAPAAAAQSAPVSAPRPAGGGSFGYGMQINPYGGADLGFASSALKNAGFNWVKWQVPWKEMEGAPGQIGWQDGVVDHFAGQGLNILASIVKAPNWARPGGTDFGVEGPPADPQTYANFVGAYAGHYCGKVKAIEVWNEQNLHYEWGNEQISPERYMELLKRAYAAIKAACPQMLVISGAPTPTGAPLPWGIDDMTYLERMYQLGLKNYADGIGAHPSGYNCPADGDWRTLSDPTASFRGPSDNHHHSWCFRGTMEGYRNIMQKYGDTGKRIWPTEFGWAVGPAFNNNYGYANDNTLDEQARWIVQAYQMAKNWGFVGPMFLWNLNFGITNPGTELQQFAVWGRPAYDAVKNMPK